MNNAVEEIKDRLPIEDLVSQYVQLKKAGRSLKGLCPFHSEKTPSFVVSPDRGIAYCFGCNRGGDIFKFIQEIEGIDFVDALKVLAERTGVKLEQTTTQTIISSDQKEQLIQLHESATAFYSDQLWNTSDGAKIIDYLHKRGLIDESIRQYRLGFSPDSYEATYSHLLTKGFTKKMLVSAGIAMTRETTVENIYDRFRGRLMFPIMDSFGRVVGFGGRALKKDQEPKYLNSPETVLYRKSRLLYGFNFSKQATKEASSVVIVEGYMDAIAAYQAGVKNVVASSGTALTANHLRILKPFAQTLVLAFDMDIAGQEAAKRAYEVSMDFDFSLKVMVLPEGKDIAEFCKTRAADLSPIVTESLPYGDYWYGKLLSTYGTDNLSSKKRILQDFLPFFHQLKSSIEKDVYVRKLALDLSLKETQVYDEFKNLKLPQFHPARNHGALDDNAQGLETQKKYGIEELLLGLLMEFPRLAKFFLPKLSEKLFMERLKPIYNVFTAHYNDAGAETVPDVIGLLPKELQEEASLLSLYITEHYTERSEDDVEKEMEALARSLKKRFLSGRGEDLQKQIRQAENVHDKALLKELLEQLNALHREVKD